jgi:pyruvate kinase
MRRLRRTKILATLGPASSDRNVIADLFRAGADVFRINMSHTSHERMRELVALIRAVEFEYGRPIGILVDLQGPKLRIGRFGGGPITLAKGDTFFLDADEAPGDATRVHLPHAEIFAAIQPGHPLLLDDGKVRLTATEVDAKRIATRVEVGGKLSDRKGVSLPQTTLGFSALAAKDRSDLDAALDAGIDWVALSFIQRPDDIAEAKKITRGRALVMAKIEKPQAVERLGDIIDITDALMVARGDLGVELPLELVPGIQKQMTRLARRAGKPVVVATQMLESMISSPVPTRAEVSDVANAVLDGTDAVMLSAETASGRYPVETIEAMSQICVEAERYDVGELDRDFFNRTFTRIDQSVAMAALFTAHHLRVKAIAALTQSGSTALWISRHNCGCAIFALTPEVASQRKMALYRNVHPLYLEQGADRDQVLHAAEDLLLEKGQVQRGDLIVLTIGEPMGKSGGTNAMKIVRVGDLR